MEAGSGSGERLEGERGEIRCVQLGGRPWWCLLEGPSMDLVWNAIWS
jgi:hypothetical protein